MHSITLWGVGMSVIKEKEDDPPNEPDIDIDGIGQGSHGELPLPTVLGRTEPGAGESPLRASRNSERRNWNRGSPWFSVKNVKIDTTYFLLLIC